MYIYEIKEINGMFYYIFDSNKSVQHFATYQECLNAATNLLKSRLNRS